MNLFTGVSVGFLLIYLVVGVYVARNVKTLNDFYVMGRNAPPFLITGTRTPQRRKLRSETLARYLGKNNYPEGALATKRAKSTGE